MVTSDQILAFEVRTQVYDLLANLYLSPPDDDTLTRLKHPGFTSDWPLARDQADVEAGLSRLSRALPQVTAAQLQDEFHRLFGTLGPAAAPPWQSVYLDRERVVMGEETLRIRELFARYGLAFVHRNRLPDDHLGLELQFLSVLAGRTAEALARGDCDAVRPLLEGMQECLDNHLLRWLDQFVARAEAASPTGVYAGLSRLTLGVVRSDSRQIRQQLAVMHR